MLAIGQDHQKRRPVDLTAAIVSDPAGHVRIDGSGMLEAAREVRDKGTFGYLERTIATPEWNAFMQS